MNELPSPAGHNGRGADGRFRQGNRLGKGNPHHRAVAELRSALLASVTAGDVREIIEALKKAAKSGDTTAAREILDRTVGRAVASDILQRLEAVEQAIAERD
jgi:hypothetical protein